MKVEVTFGHFSDPFDLLHPLNFIILHSLQGTANCSQQQPRTKQQKAGLRIWAQWLKLQKQLLKENSLETEMSVHRKQTDFVLEEIFIQAWSTGACWMRSQNKRHEYKCYVLMMTYVKSCSKDGSRNLAFENFYLLLVFFVCLSPERALVVLNCCCSLPAGMRGTKTLLTLKMELSQQGKWTAIWCADRKVI